MKKTDWMVLLSLGGLLWAGATYLYFQVGVLAFEKSPWVFFSNTILTGLGISALPWLLMKWRKISVQFSVYVALALTLPGMFLDVIILYGFSEIMTTMDPNTAGRYGAFLFFCYATALTVCLMRTLKLENHSLVREKSASQAIKSGALS